LQALNKIRRADKENAEMNQRLVTVGQLADAISPGGAAPAVTLTRLRNWTGAGLLKPVSTGEGPGRHRLYDPATALPDALVLTALTDACGMHATKAPMFAEAFKLAREYVPTEDNKESTYLVISTDAAGPFNPRKTTIAKVPASELQAHIERSEEWIIASAHIVINLDSLHNAVEACIHLWRKESDSER
jgi:hypothetical protein